MLESLYYRAGSKTMYVFWTKSQSLRGGRLVEFIWLLVNTKYIILISLCGDYLSKIIPWLYSNVLLLWNHHVVENSLLLAPYDDSILDIDLSLMDWNVMEIQRVSLLNGFLTLFYLTIDLALLYRLSPLLYSVDAQIAKIVTYNVPLNIF